MLHLEYVALICLLATSSLVSTVEARHSHGLDLHESASMGASVAHLGDSLHGAIRHKSNFIMSQAKRGAEAGEKLTNMMQSGLQHGLQSRSGGGGHMMNGLGNLMGQAQDFMMKSHSQIHSQLKSGFQGSMGRMASMHGIGENMMNQAQGISRTLTNGLSGAVMHLQSTGDQVLNQLKAGHSKNTKAMGGIFDSMHGSMGKMGLDMQKNMDGLMEHAQNTASTVTESLKNVITAPLEMAKSLGQGLMRGAGGMKGGSMGGGRGY